MSSASYVAEGLLARAAEDELEAARGLGAPYYLGAAALTLLLMAGHLLAPRLRLLLAGHARSVGSFGGGMAAAYVFLHLIPELHGGHELLGKMIYVVPLVGFVTYFLIQRRLDRTAGADPSRSSAAFVIKLANLGVYNWLIVYATPEAAIESGWRATTIVFALLLHLVYADFGFGQEFQRRFDSIGRYALAAAALCGYAVIVAEQKTSESLTDIFTAFLAGSVLFNVFREEVPAERKSRIGWFIAGIAVFAALAAFSAG